MFQLTPVHKAYRLTHGKRGRKTLAGVYKLVAYACGPRPRLLIAERLHLFEG